MMLFTTQGFQTNFSLYPEGIYLIEIKAYNTLNWPGASIFTIDLCCVPLVCAL